MRSVAMIGLLVGSACSPPAAPAAPAASAVAEDGPGADVFRELAVRNAAPRRPKLGAIVDYEELDLPRGELADEEVLAREARERRSLVHDLLLFSKVSTTTPNHPQTEQVRTKLFQRGMHFVSRASERGWVVPAAGYLVLLQETTKMEAPAATREQIIQQATNQVKSASTSADAALAESLLHASSSTLGSESEPPTGLLAARYGVLGSMPFRLNVSGQCHEFVSFIEAEYQPIVRPLDQASLHLSFNECGPTHTTYDFVFRVMTEACASAESGETDGFLVEPQGECAVLRGLAHDYLPMDEQRTLSGDVSTQQTALRRDLDLFFLQVTQRTDQDVFARKGAVLWRDVALGRLALGASRFRGDGEVSSAVHDLVMDTGLCPREISRLIRGQQMMPSGDSAAAESANLPPSEHLIDCFLEQRTD